VKARGGGGPFLGPAGGKIVGGHNLETVKESGKISREGGGPSLYYLWRPWFLVLSRKKRKRVGGDNFLLENSRTRVGWKVTEKRKDAHPFA